MPKQTVKNGLRVEKIKLPQINFFWKNNQWNCHVPISPFHYPKFKKSSWGWSRVMRMCHFWAQNGPFVMNKNFLEKTIIIIFIYLLALFIVQNLKKLSRSRVMTMCHFWTQNGPFAPIFFGKFINIILIYLLAPFIGKNFLKILPADPKLWGCAIFGPKMASFPKW